MRFSELSKRTAFFFAIANNFALSISVLEPRKLSLGDLDLERERPRTPPRLRRDKKNALLVNQYKILKKREVALVYLKKTQDSFVLQVGLRFRRNE